MKRYKVISIIGGLMIAAVLISTSIARNLMDRHILPVTENCVVITNYGIVVNEDETISNDELLSLFKQALVVRTNFYENRKQNEQQGTPARLRP